MMNLSAYKPQARHAEKEVYLPPDRSQRASDLKRNLTPPAGEMEGEGLIYDVARAAKKTLDTVDDAALRGAKWALGDVASPDKATVRPDSSGLRLHIDVPAHTLKLPTR
ncbi:MAG: hypothetical protein GX256_04410 [Fretibacterium sp.]|nr:hypothetical protein [Fretibacterium sp.]